MAVYTKLSENQLKEFFSKYNLGELLNYKEVKEGIENTNYFIQTEKGKFILTLYEKRVEEKDLPFFMSLMKNLFDKNFPSPEPIININGNYISEILGKKAAVVSFLDGYAKKILNPNWSDIELEPIETSIRDKIGHIVSPNNLEEVLALIRILDKNTQNISELIKGIRQKIVYNIGESAKIGAEYIRQLHNESKD